MGRVPTVNSFICMAKALCTRPLIPTQDPREGRPVLFVSDPPHLIKTTRNCWSHSGFSGTRLMKVSDILRGCLRSFSFVNSIQEANYWLAESFHFISGALFLIM